MPQNLFAKTERKTVKEPSVLPYYLAGAVFLLYACVFPLYRVVHFLLAFGVTAAAFVLLHKVFPGKEKVVEVRVPLTLTGDADVDALLKDADIAIQKIREANRKIPGEAVSAKIYEIEELTAQIFAHVAEQPKKLPRIRKFISYYLPTTLKLLESYARMDAQSSGLSNVEETKIRIESMLDTIIVAYRRQLDNLFADEALDISTDITVLEGMLKSEGLTGGSGLEL